MANFRLEIYIERIQNLSHFSRLFVCLFVCLFVGGVAEGWAGWLVSWLVVWLDRLMVGWLAGNGWRKSVSLSQHTTFVTKCNH